MESRAQEHDCVEEDVTHDLSRDILNDLNEYRRRHREAYLQRVTKVKQEGAIIEEKILEEKSAEPSSPFLCTATSPPVDNNFLSEDERYAWQLYHEEQACDNQVRNPDSSYSDQLIQPFSFEDTTAHRSPTVQAITSTRDSLEAHSFQDARADQKLQDQGTNQEEAPLNLASMVSSFTNNILNIGSFTNALGMPASTDEEAAKPPSEQGNQRNTPGTNSTEIREAQQRINLGEHAASPVHSETDPLIISDNEADAPCIDDPDEAMLQAAIAHSLMDR